MVEEQRNMFWLNYKHGASRRRQQTDLHLSIFFWISYRRFLDTEWEGRTRRIKKQHSESACRGVERFWAVGSEYTLCNKAKQRGFEDEARKRIRHSHAQCKNNQGVLGIVPGLNRVIPVVKQLD
jgi:hypothetical protein